MSELSIDLIRRDGGTQPRAELNQDLIKTYAEAMKRGDQFDPVIVYHDGKDHWLADGFHRVGAALLNESKVIDADIRQGTRRDAILFSVGANETHGLRRSQEDKERAIKTVLADEEWRKWSNSEIARRCKVDHTTVKKYRDQLYPAKSQDSARTVTRAGTTYNMNTEKLTAPKLTQGKVIKVDGRYVALMTALENQEGYYRLEAGFVMPKGIERRKIVPEQVTEVTADRVPSEFLFDPYYTRLRQFLIDYNVAHANGSQPITPTEDQSTTSTDLPSNSPVPTLDPNKTDLPVDAISGQPISPSNSEVRTPDPKQPSKAALFKERFVAAGILNVLAVTTHNSQWHDTYSAGFDAKDEASAIAAVEGYAASIKALGFVIVNQGVDIEPGRATLGFGGKFTPIIHFAEAGYVVPEAKPAEPPKSNGKAVEEPDPEIPAFQYMSLEEMTSTVDRVIRAALRTVPGLFSGGVPNDLITASCAVNGFKFTGYFGDPTQPTPELEPVKEIAHG